MSIVFLCVCGKKLTTKDEFAGRKVKCPECQQVLIVPTGEDEDSSDGAVSYDVAGSKSTSNPVHPSLPKSRPSKNSHEIDYHIHGSDLQLVEIELDPKETVIAEAGALAYMDDGITFESKMGDGSDPNQGFFKKMFQAGKRAMTGESLFMTHFTNAGVGKKHVAFSAAYPGKIIPVYLPDYDHEITCQKEAFLCGAFGTKIDIAFTKKLGTGFFGGEGFILQKLHGDGFAFLHACGAIVEKQLTGGKIKVDTGCLVGFTKGLDYDIERAGNLKSMIFGGEGLFLATISGHGTVWMQSLPFSRMAERIVGAAPSTSSPLAGTKEEGSILGGIGRLISGFNDE